MYILPLPFLLGTLATLGSLAMLGGGIYIVWGWIAGTIVATSTLVSGIAMLAWSLLGRQIVLAMYPRGQDEPRAERSPDTATLEAPDGSRLHIEMAGPADKPVIVLTHGWALDNTAWYQPVTLVGHSIGGFMMLTLARKHPELFRHKVNGMVFMDTTHTWPLNTVMASGLLKVLRWPAIAPLLLLTIALWPLMWLSNLQPNVIAKGLRAVLRWDETSTPATIPVPVRVLAGDADFVMIKPAGHNGLLESRQYGTAIAEFVAEVGARMSTSGQQSAGRAAKGA